MSAIAYGCWRLADDGTTVAEAGSRIGAAVDEGLTLIDTADIYGFDGASGFGAAETLLGRVLAASPGLRDRITLATKGGIRPPVPYDQRHDVLVAACDASLARLGIDHVDCYLVHRPDLLTHPADLAATLVHLVRTGRAASVGLSNFTPAHTEAVQAHLPFPLAALQPEFSPLHPDPLIDGTLDLAARHGYTVLAWSPLGGGRLLTGADGPTGSPGVDQDRIDRLVPLIGEMASGYGVSPTALILAWVMRHPAGVIPIVGTQRPDRIVEAARAAHVELTAEDWYRVLVASRGEPMP